MESPFSSSMLLVPIPVKLFVHFGSCMSYSVQSYLVFFVFRSTGYTLGSLKEVTGTVSESLDLDDDEFFNYNDSDVDL